MRIQLLPSRAGVAGTRENLPASVSIAAFARCTCLGMSQSRTPSPRNQFVDHTGKRLEWTNHSSNILTSRTVHRCQGLKTWARVLPIPRLRKIRSKPYGMDWTPWSGSLEQQLWTLWHFFLTGLGALLGRTERWRTLRTLKGMSTLWAFLFWWLK